MIEFLRRKVELLMSLLPMRSSSIQLWLENWNCTFKVARGRLIAICWKMWGIKLAAVKAPGLS